MEEQLCPMCDGQSAYMGGLGKSQWFRCNDCGMEFRKEWSDAPVFETKPEKSYRIGYFSLWTKTKWYWSGTADGWQMESSKAYLYKSPKAALRAMKRRIKLAPSDGFMDSAEIEWVTTE